MTRHHLGVRHVVIVDGRRLPEAARYLGPDYRGDLLRRPARPSTSAEAAGLLGQVEDVHGHGGSAHALFPFFEALRHTARLSMDALYP